MAPSPCSYRTVRQKGDRQIAIRHMRVGGGGGQIVQQIKSCRRQLHRPNKLTPAPSLAQTAVQALANVYFEDEPGQRTREAAHQPCRKRRSDEGAAAEAHGGHADLLFGHVVLPGCTPDVADKRLGRRRGGFGFCLIFAP
jgi:hypothetical protein